MENRSENRLEKDRSLFLLLPESISFIPWCLHNPAGSRCLSDPTCIPWLHRHLLFLPGGHLFFYLMVTTSGFLWGSCSYSSLNLSIQGEVTSFPRPPGLATVLDLVNLCLLSFPGKSLFCGGHVVQARMVRQSSALDVSVMYIPFYPYQFCELYLCGGLLTDTSRDVSEFSNATGRGDSTWQQCRPCHLGIYSLWMTVFCFG